nr:hypothetical protein Iba_chr05cCG0600 [Ipomoea batatas]
MGRGSCNRQLTIIVLKICRSICLSRGPSDLLLVRLSLAFTDRRIIVGIIGGFTISLSNLMDFSVKVRDAKYVSLAESRLQSFPNSLCSSCPENRLSNLRTSETRTREGFLFGCKKKGLAESLGSKTVFTLVAAKAAGAVAVVSRCNA